MRPLLLAVAVVLSARASSAAAEPWTLARSAHFEVATDAGAGMASEAALRLERLREVLGRLLPLPEEEGLPLRVLLLRERSQFVRLVPFSRGRAEDVAGFFLTGTDGPLVVVSLSTAAGEAPAERFRTLDHEYAHVHLNRTLPAQPVWVAEGLAEAFSGGELAGPRARLAATAGGAGSGRESSGIRLADLLEANWHSPVYQGLSSSSTFYADSLALVRWILLRRGLTALQLFLDAVADGQDARAAFASHFGDPGWVERQLEEAPADLSLEVDAGEAAPLPLVVSAAPEADIEYRLGDVLLNGGHTREAQRLLESALRKDPAHAPARAGLAQALLQFGKWAEARRELQRALASRPDDPAALLRFARLLLAEGRQREEGLSPDVEEAAVAALEKAVALAPDLAEAVELLAVERPEPLARRIALLRRSFARDPGEPELGLTLASLLVRANDVSAALRVLRLTRDAARDETYLFLVDHRLSQVGRYVAATAELAGRLVRLQCRDDGSLRFTIAPAAGGELALEAPSARSFFVSDRSGAGEVELTCGRLDRPVRARYRPSAEPGLPATLLSLHVSGD